MKLKASGAATPEASDATTDPVRADDFAGGVRKLSYHIAYCGAYTQIDQFRCGRGGFVCYNQSSQPLTNI